MDDDRAAQPDAHQGGDGPGEQATIDVSEERAAEQQRSTALALRHAELPLEQLWLRFFGLGGAAGLLDIDAYLHGIGKLPVLDRDVLSQAVNERLDELSWSHRATYSHRFRDSQPHGAAFTALIRILEDAELAPPDRLPAIVHTAAHILGVRITLYLVDFDQQALHAVLVPPVTGDEQAVFDVDTTLPGRAFRKVQILPSESSGGLRLWVPLLDGVERLGVLDVRVEQPDDLYDPGLRAQCRWLSMLIGHLVTLMSQYGDAFDRIRLRTSRTVNAELNWSLLPPLTAGVDRFVVTGVLEPRDTVSGDAFDYALSETTASLIILDSVGHDLRSALITSVALAAYHRTRHAGHGLFEQARTIDEAIAGEFGPGMFATAVLTELDLATGRLRYINAGHPSPLIMRAGKIVKPLGAGRRRPLGLGMRHLEVGEETLQPEDWLVLHTDGITEARNGAGEFFGEARLADLLRREAAAGYPPPETARRLVKAVLAYQNGQMQDDATVVLARWTNPGHVTPN